MQLLSVGILRKDTAKLWGGVSFLGSDRSTVTKNVPYAVFPIRSGPIQSGPI